MDLLATDRLDVLVIVDNVTDSLSTNPMNVVPEWMGLLSAGRLQRLSGRATCCAHHRLSLLLTTHLGSARHTLLFDAGPEGAVSYATSKSSMSICRQSVPWCCRMATGTMPAVF